MEEQRDYLKINQDLWNQKVKPHMASDFYDVKGFIEGNTSLQNIELDLLGDLSDKKVLHLQCHFGQDSISLSRLGAQVTAVDFSEQAIEEAKKLAYKTGEQVNFICCDVYSLPNFLDEKFDLVFTSYGTIGWLPDINQWAQVVAHFLKAGGQFIFVEFHPFIWMFDDHFQDITYRYFKDEPIVEDEVGSYTDMASEVRGRSITWNHSLSSVIQSLIDEGISIDRLEEYDYAPYNCFQSWKEVEDGKFRIGHLENKIPMVYSIVAHSK